MRKIVVFTSVSLDGYMEGLEHDISWHLVDDELHRYMNAQVAAKDVLLDGRVTHELMADFWPTADEDPDAPAVIAEFAQIWRDKPKIVFSSTFEDTRWNTTVRRKVDPAEIQELKAQPGGDMVVGGADLVDTFRQLDLIDEYHMLVHPVLVGAGTPFFKGADALSSLDLVETRTFGNGVVLLRYARAAG